MSDVSREGGEPATVNERGPELAVALLLLLIAGLVVSDSLRVGTGWADDGPRSGYFPFYIGLMLGAASATILVKQLLTWGRSHKAFAERSQIAQVVSVFVPMVVYVAAIPFLGIYVASALLIGYFMLRHGGYRLPATLFTAVAVVGVIFMVFERWFLVPLPKGPVEHLLGF